MKKITIIVSLILTAVFISSGQEASNDTTWNQTGENGQKQGWWKKKYSDGEMMYKGYFKDGKPIGRFVRYKQDGTKIVQFFKEGSDTVKVKFYYNNDSIAASGRYVNRKKDGLWKNYSFYSGYLTSENSYKQGEKHGKSTKYYKSGEVNEVIEYKKGVKHGDWKQYFKNGQVKTECAYENGKMTGEYKAYYPNGLPYIVGEYKNGYKEGKWLWYDDKGKIEQDVEYEDGYPVDAEEYEKIQTEKLNKLEENKGKIEDPAKVKNINKFFDK